MHMSYTPNNLYDSISNMCLRLENETLAKKLSTVPRLRTSFQIPFDSWGLPYPQIFYTL
jgi:hypothetical protein